MLKKIIFLSLSFNLLTSQQIIANNPPEEGMSLLECTVKGVITVGFIAAVTVALAPLAPIVIPTIVASAKTAATVAAAKVAAATAATKAAGGTAVVYVVDAAHTAYTVAEPVIQGAAAVSYITAPLSKAILAAQLMQPYVLPTEKEQLQQGIKRNFDTYVQAEKELITCMDRHVYPDRTIVPKACEEAALNYYFHATGKQYYDKLMAKNG